jgi:two-component system chemotaxis response regulator CheY
MNNENVSILFIDDDKFLLDMYALKFSKNNFDVHTAQGPEEGLKLLRDGLRPNIILVDVVMPAMDGIELLETAQKEGLVKGSVLIILTNQGLPDDIARAKKIGVDGYIIKATTIPSEVLIQVQKIYSSSIKQ